jgi:hypothetical protein
VTAGAWALPILALLLAPSGLRGQEVLPMAATLRDQVTAQGLLTWSASEPVTWPNFQGPEQVVTIEAAQILSGVTYLIQCRDSVMAFAVLATFDPRISWVRSDILRDSVASRRSLQHERTHFNLTEVMARRVRQGFAALTGACPGHEDRAAALFQESVTELQRLHTQYDDETLHGMKAGAQREWDQRMMAALDSLAAYAAPFGRE